MSNPNEPTTIGRVNHFFFLIAGFLSFFLALVYFYLEDRYLSFEIFNKLDLLNKRINDDVPGVLAATGAAFIAIWAVIYSVHSAEHRAHSDWVRAQNSEFEVWRTATNGILIANNRRLREFVNYWIPPLASNFPRLDQWTPADIARQYILVYKRAFSGERFILPRTLQELSTKMDERESTFRTVRAMARRDRELALEIGIVSVSEASLQSWIDELTNALAPVEDAIGRQMNDGEDNGEYRMMDVMLDPMSELRWLRMAHLGGIDEWIWLCLVATGSVSSSHMRRLGLSESQSWIEGFQYFRKAFELSEDDDIRYSPLDSIVGDALWSGLVSGYRRKVAMIDAFSQYAEPENFGGDDDFARFASKGNVAMMRRTLGQKAAHNFLSGISSDIPIVYDMPTYLGIRTD